MANFDFKTATPDSTFPSGGFLFGADSQSAATPSIYAGTTYLAYILGLANTWTAAQTISVNGAVSAPAFKGTGTWYSGGSATTTKPYWLIEPAGTTSTAWSTSGTGLGINAATGFAGNLIDAQISGVSKFRFTASSVLWSGDISITNGPTIVGGGAAVFSSAAGYGFVQAYGILDTGSSAGIGQTPVQNGGVSVSSAAPICWSSAASVTSGTADLFLYRDGAAGKLSQRNGTNAQESRVYGTYTDASNFRRVSLAISTAGVATLVAEGAGTGASGNVLHISSLPTSNPGPGILWNNAGTPAIGT